MLKLDKILSWGLYLLIFLLPLQTRLILLPGAVNSTYFEYTTISIFFSDVLIILLFVLSFFRGKKNYQPELLKNKTIKWLIIGWWDFFIFVSIFFASDKGAALFGYFRFLIAAGLFWLIINLKWERLKLYYSFISGAVIQALIGLWQFHMQKDFAAKWLGIAMHKAGELGTSVVEFGNSGEGERWLRAYGGLDHPNVFGGFMAVALLVVLLVFLDKLKQGIMLSDYFIFLLAAIVLSAGVVVSFSRSSWIGLAGSLGLILLLSIGKRKLELQKYTLYLILIFASIFFLYYQALPELFAARLNAAGRIENISINQRIEGINDAKQLISQNFWFGTGINNYGIALVKTARERKDGFYYQPVHNTFLLVAAEIGCLGLLGFIFLIFYQIVKLAKPSNTDENIIFLGILIGMVVLMMFDHWWWSLHFGILFFWFLMGLTAKERY